MASALERRFDIARSSLGRRAQEQSMAEQEALRQKFATQGSLESGAAIKAATGQEEALARKASQAGTDIGRAEAQAAAALSEQKTGREFQAGEAISGRTFAGGESEKQRTFVGEQAALDRILEDRKIKIMQNELALNEQVTLSNLRRQKEERDKVEPSTIDKLITGQMGTELIERLIGRKLSDKEKLLLPHHQLLGTDLETLQAKKAKVKIGFPKIF